MTLHEDGLARLDQVVLGLLPISELPNAEVYADAEGTPVATREGDRLTPLQPSRWQRPDPSTTAPVVVAVAEQIPVGALPSPDAILLLPAGGVRPDDVRFAAWAQAWRAVAGTVIEVPVTPAEASERAEPLASAYSSGELLTVSTVEMPAGPGRVVLFTGFSGSGKSTIARNLTARLAGERTVTLLDGDVVRTHLSKGLGFTREDRDTNVRRIGFVARLLARHGVFVITAAISPYASVRNEIRELAGGEGLPFIEVFVNPTLESLVKRDVKGLYKRALAGEIPHFPGVPDPYEPPARPDIEIKTDAEPVADSVERILAALIERGLLPQGDGR